MTLNLKKDLDQESFGFFMFQANKTCTKDHDSDMLCVPGELVCF
jgi:hypothetical protein